MGWLTQDRTAASVLAKQKSPGANGDNANVQMFERRIGNHTLLMPSLLKVMTVQHMQVYVYISTCAYVISPFLKQSILN